MTYSEKAMRLAISGGYRKMWINGATKTSRKLTPSDLVNPDFWEALGHKLDWPASICMNCGEANSVSCCSYTKRTRGWVWWWLQFTYSLADGKSFEDALKIIIK